MQTSITGEYSPPLPASPQGEGRRGFTLIETLVVIVILGILVAWAAPSLSSAMDTAALRESSGRLAAAARYARHYAAAHGCECRLQFDREKRTYAVLAPAAEDPDRFEPVTGAARGQLDQKVTFAALRIEPRSERDGGDAVTFSPTGEADAAAIQLTDGRRTFTVLIAPNTGRVQLAPDRIDQTPTDRQDLDA